MNAVRHIPDGYQTVTPYLVIKGAASAIDFYKKVFSATEVMRMPQADGRIGHAELKIGDSHIMLADEFPEKNIRGPESFGGAAVSMMVYVPDVDSVFKKAVDAGAKVNMPVQDQFYGDRNGKLTDPFGHQWMVATHTEDVSPEDMQKRMAAQPKG